MTVTSIMRSASVHLFCIDGTNLVRGSFGYGGASFQAQEDADSRHLVEALNQLCHAAGGGVEVEVFFDGGGRAGLSAAASHVHVSFAQELEADDVILDRVRAN